MPGIPFSTKPLIAISQRVDVITGRDERRDALDQRWVGFLATCGFLAVPIPNEAAAAAALVDTLPIAGVLLTGGNDLAAHGGDAPERDVVERLLIEHAIDRNRPLLAVCRGLQMLAHHFGGRLERITGHVGVDHPILLDNGAVDTVNSYHAWGLHGVPPGFVAWATAPDGSIEAVRHRTLPLLGMLWHPERNTPFRAIDVERVRRHFTTAMKDNASSRQAAQERVPMKAIILAAGRGSRMKSRTEDRPKCLVEIAGRSLLDCQRAALADGGTDSLAVVRGYRGEAFEGRGLTLFDNPRWAETNMVMSLVQAGPWLSAEPCIVSYADIFYQPETVRRLVAAEGDIVISYDPEWLTLWRARFADPLSDAESFLLDGSGRVVDIGRKVRSLDDIQGQYMGLLKFTPAGWARVTDHLGELDPHTRDKLDMTGLLSRLVAAGVAVQAVPCAPGWGEIDSESDRDYYEAEVAAGRTVLPA